MTSGAPRSAFAPRFLGGRLAVLLGFLAAALVFSIVVGPTDVDLGRALRGDDSQRDLFKLLTLRLPRAVAAVIVGGSLASAGVVLQGLVHNPLASPYILGVSAGGSLGAVLAIRCGAPFVVPFAFLGAATATLAVHAAARYRGRTPATRLLLAGVIVNTFFSACILFVTYTATESATLRIVRWLIGGMAELYEWGTLAWSGSLLVLLGLGLFLEGRTLNLLAAGDGTAERMGVAVQRTRTRLFLAAALLTAVAVAISGPIGFVGLIVPHVLRLLVGSDHRTLIPATVLAGGGFLAAADTLASVVWRNPLPVGLLMAVLGAPFFVFLLRTRVGDAE